MLVFQGESAANGLCFTRDNARLLVARRGEVDVWELATGTRTQLLGAPKLGQSVIRGKLHTYPPRVLLGASGFALRWHTGKPFEFAQLDGRTGRTDVRSPLRVVVSSDGTRLLMNTRRERKNWFDCYKVSTNGNFCLTQQWSVSRKDERETLVGFVGASRFLTHSRLRLNFNSLSDGAFESETKYPSHHCNGAVIPPDGSWFVVRGYKKLYKYGSHDWSKSLVVSGPAAQAAHPTRPLFACTSATLVKYLDANTGKPVKKFAWKLGSMCAVAFSADGALAAASATDGRIVVWDADA